MTDTDEIRAVCQLEQRLAELGHRVEVDREHKRRLREELLRRYQELSVVRSQRATGMLWAGAFRPKRLTLVAPAALAAASLLLVLAVAVQVSGGPSAQSAQAAQLTGALVRTAPRVTGWEMTLQRLRDNQVSSYECTQPLRADQHLFVRGNHAYLYASGRWYEVTSTWYLDSPRRADIQCPSEWQWAFAALPAHLAQGGYRFVRSVSRPFLVGIRYSLRQTGNARVLATAWVDRDSGLIRRLERDVLLGRRLVEQEVATFHYARKP